MRPVHPNDVANQVALMKLVRDAIPNSIPVVKSVEQRTSDTESYVSSTSASVLWPRQGEGFGR